MVAKPLWYFFFHLPTESAYLEKLFSSSLVYKPLIVYHVPIAILELTYGVLKSFLSCLRKWLEMGMGMGMEMGI